MVHQLIIRFEQSKLYPDVQTLAIKTTVEDYCCRLHQNKALISRIIAFSGYFQVNKNKSKIKWN